MDNNLPQLQNDDHALRLLITQRRMYGRAKRVAAVQGALVVVLPCLFLVLQNYLVSLKIWTALASLSIAIVDIVVLEPSKAFYRRRAADTQELFDCYVLDLEWSTLKGERPDKEDSFEHFSEPDVERLRNWYPSEVGQLPLHLARIICQRSNCWWDERIRSFYRIGLILLCALILVSVLIFGLLSYASLQEFILLMLAPVLPVILWGARETKAQANAAHRARRLKSFGSALWKQATIDRNQASSITIQSRRFQDEIYEHRRSSPLVFDWFYRIFRNKFESQMQFSATEMVREAQNK